MLNMIAPTNYQVDSRALNNTYTKWGSVVSYSVPWPQVSLIHVLRQSANAPRMYWKSGQTPLAFAGCGIAARLTAR